VACLREVSVFFLLGVGRPTNGVRKGIATQWVSSLILVWIGLLFQAAATQAAESQPVDDAALCARALVSEGDTSRLQRVLFKARRGGEITVGVIGGSITQGASASKPENRYGALIAAWCRERFPGAPVNLVNAGIGATGSNYGALRARRDLLSQHPDLVIVEYAVSLIHEIAAPDISDALARKQPSVIEAAVARANFAAVAATVGAVAGVVILGRYILSVFGPDFVRAYPILIVLVASQFIRAAFGPTVLTLISAGAQKSVVVVFSIAIVSFALANLVLVPMFGLSGAAAAFAVMTGFWTASLAVVSKRKTGLRLDIAASLGVLRRSPRTFASFIGGTAVQPRN